MHNKIRVAVAPVYLLACLVLGWSRQGDWQNVILQLAGLVIIGWAAASRSNGPISHSARLLLLLAIGAVALVGLQAVPWPAHYWAHGIRGRIAHDYRLLGTIPPLPSSLAPYASLASLFGLIPPLAMFCAVARSSFRFGLLLMSLLAGAIADVLLSAQHAAGGVGANADHLASLLLIALTFAAAIPAAASNWTIPRYRAVILSLGLAAILLAGLALTNSRVGYALSVPLLFAIALDWLPPDSPSRRLVILLGILSLAASGTALSLSPVGGTIAGHGQRTFLQSRQQIFVKTVQAAKDFMPFGSGLGSFAGVYDLYQSPATVTNERVIHADNDYAELALELGLGAIILILLFFAWWGNAVREVWRRGRGGPFVRAASIASAAMLVQSFLDFPLRSAAVSTSFAMCLALLAARQGHRVQKRKDLRSTRHIVIDQEVRRSIL